MKLSPPLAKFAFVLSGMLGGILLVAFVSAGGIYDYTDTVDPQNLPPVDVIVCLAGGKGRFEAASDLWFRYAQAGQRPILFISGMGRQADWKVFERQVRKEVLQVLKPEDVILETESGNTRENALVFSRFANQRKWKRMLLVTASYHMKRAYYIFDHVLNPQHEPGEPSPNRYDPQRDIFRIETHTLRQEPFRGRAWRSDPYAIRVTFTEYVKWVFYRSLW